MKTKYHWSVEFFFFQRSGKFQHGKGSVCTACVEIYTFSIAHR